MCNLKGFLIRCTTNRDKTNSLIGITSVHYSKLRRKNVL